MKQIVFAILISSGFILFVSCNKETPVSTIINTPPPPPASNKPPVAIVSMRYLIITLPNNSATLNGSTSYDPDGTIVSYLWAKFSGPAQYNLINPNQAKVSVNNLEAGTYGFRLTVVDDKGAAGNDTMMITVEKAVPSCTMPLTPFGNLSIARSEVVAAAAGNKILFAGGIDQTDYASTRVDIYDKVSQAWSTAELSAPRTGMAVAVLGNKIFFAGGVYNSAYSSDYSSRVDIYDAVTNIWSTAELSVERERIAAASTDNKIFFSGGTDDYGAKDVVDIYDMLTSTWSTNHLSEPKTYHSATALNHKIYFAGGSHSIMVNSAKVDIYDVFSNSWSSISLSEPKMFMANIAVENTIFWAGGQTSISLPYSYSDKVEMYDVNTGLRTYHQLSRARGDFKAVKKQNKILFYSGDPGSVDIYDVTSQTWSVCSIPHDLQYTGVISTGDKVYIAGGFLNGVISKQVWLLDF